MPLDEVDNRGHNILPTFTTLMYIAFPGTCSGPSSSAQSITPPQAEVLRLEKPQVVILQKFEVRRLKAKCDRIYIYAWTQEVYLKFDNEFRGRIQLSWHSGWG